MADRTVPAREAGLPLRALVVEVVAGQDTGARFEAEDEVVAIGSAPGNQLVLTDPTVSRFHCELRRHGDRIDVVDLDSTNGTAIGAVLVKEGAFGPGTELTLGRTKVKVGDGQRVLLDMHGGDALGGLRGRSMAMRRLMAKIEVAARGDVSILVTGESGTGKELIARAVHDGSPRAHGPFITVDCASLSPTLIASELFGHERGAFTGAERRYAGAFERAHGGTVFLDEIGELPAESQASLLGVLERRRFRRVGGAQEISVDLRVVAATNRDLRTEVNSGTFRHDLYYRLAVVTFAVPSLRERPDDVPLLVQHFLRENGHTGPTEAVFPAEEMARLCAHRWPGNVRELRNLVEGTLITGEAPELHTHAAGSRAVPAEEQDLSPMPFKKARDEALRQFEARYLTSLLERSRGNVSQAARDAELHRSYFFDLLKRHGLR